MVTTEMWAKLKPSERFMYKIVRHPLTITFGYFTIFMYGMCASSFLRNPRKNWDSLVALILNAGLTVGLVWLFGFELFFFVYFLPLFVACAAGAYLFYAQHNFPEIYVQPRDKWEYSRAALESSSYMETGPILGWLTGNIGYHHVHHLNPGIPFYRLPEAMASIPELQAPHKTSLRPRDIVDCFRQKLWDVEAERMVGYPKGT
jgi:omega-6 fatty acid desaturase (delta-12 desaturase)